MYQWVADWVQFYEKTATLLKAWDLLNSFKTEAVITQINALAFLYDNGLRDERVKCL